MNKENYRYKDFMFKFKESKIVSLSDTYTFKMPMSFIISVNHHNLSNASFLTIEFSNCIKIELYGKSKNERESLQHIHSLLEFPK